jgi:hypothetical protein
VSSLLGGYIIRSGASRYWIVLGLAMVCAASGLAWVRNHYLPVKKLGTMASVAE